ADELVTLLDEVFEDPETKAVVFSQWLRTHELIERRIANRAWGHVLFHGGVPGPHRKELIRKFKEDANCRLFLSTDAGGVGLNLQNASVVVNMDQPWNPAVLEQRIGRVHRLGQHRPVRVVHFVAQGTIEHGMLNILQFKKSLFAGALDGGQDEVFLGGTKLKRFMESVENVSTSIPNAMPAQEAAASNSDAADAAKEVPEELDLAVEAKPAEPRPASREESWNACLSAGTAFLKSLGDALAAAPAEKKVDAISSMLPIEHDEGTGRSYVKLPMPDPAILNAALGALASLVERLAKP
ncbi:MAG: C-terminal helicase domain-containing protein, partial [Candidatus Hydrogenedentes bacterium]|nr:C-terminal helicase domain-containing protein [Candidatus Hydrogenedentota bacterium]